MAVGDCDALIAMGKAGRVGPDHEADPVARFEMEKFKPARGMPCVFLIAFDLGKAIAHVKGY